MPGRTFRRHLRALRRSHTVTSLQPFTLLPRGRDGAHGPVATGSTTFDEPFHIARRFASLDHISNGQAGWNMGKTLRENLGLRGP